MKKASPILLVSALALCLTLAFALPNSPRTNQGTEKVTAPAVSVSLRPDAPLRINVLGDDSSDPRSPQINFEVTNVAGKPIHSYLVSQETTNGTEKSTGTTLSDMAATNSVLRPGQTMTDSIAYLSTTDTISQIVLALDFVEFDDGATWGPDKFESAELLRGRRAGAAEANQSFLGLRKSGGLQAVLGLLEANSLNVDLPRGKSPKWEEGFRSGVRIVSSRLKKALTDGGADAVDAELNKLVKSAAGGNDMRRLGEFSPLLTLPLLVLIPIVLIIPRGGNGTKFLLLPE